MKDIFGNALLDFHHNEFESPLLLHNEYGPPEIIPVERFFNNDDEFSELEYFALEQVQEKIMDIGLLRAGMRFIYKTGDMILQPWIFQNFSVLL